MAWPVSSGALPRYASEVIREHTSCDEGDSGQNGSRACTSRGAEGAEDVSATSGSTGSTVSVCAPMLHVLGA